MHHEFKYSVPSLYADLVVCEVVEAAGVKGGHINSYGRAVWGVHCKVSHWDGTAKNSEGISCGFLNNSEN
ncbi:hypothetical protein TGPRC2_223025 [Toxoplasma gondii TgCatPRC2]|uniref:Uncharacterized protein n=11 Tax=Toxoplasma gondii TaxID=5811 RepID=A0A125YKX7_TOXGV|nr:hypothetical protein TGME49_223025 [Toxoplasma gondii ME49]EPR58453.1 hypothetical protein TGGT1_223025 [Toxoplasma gondii GT1]ESS30011.1 hypothetical protein TGVEG_223025 [Toxoplasma gondii VEG]KAF4645688.1 hypothetical protein TGRH88_001740 [Toxoplasma gondii]KFG35929.1 hypothetical protein TGP89_223025 [Toxoplasma gondii p89]KFG41795.1 hypothetical protein TGDOM2_223025 [Toxoplasma gondii GAB2-2007-GAL-DOM2]KFG47965.1 hypothetical protein TGFOU_223025 [Toxoplasma gondii FOU]KFH03459.1 |eukprot:XP_018638333.1 hypothetical protein TGME49_223025 [Toxoplasma gondii ME49]